MNKEDHPINLDDVDREIRIEKLKQELNELSDGNMMLGGCEDCPPAVLEQFLERVKAFETADVDTDFNRLANAGVQLPPPDELDDTHLTLKLWEVIRALARMNVFMDNTDHLTDRELYHQLWHSALREKTSTLPPGYGGVSHIDLLGSGSDEDIQLYLKYYADEDYRTRWRHEFPEDPIPPMEEPPYDRDRHLPKAPF